MYALVGALLRPYTLFFLISAAALANLWIKRRESWRRLLFLTLPWAALCIISIPAISHFALGSLEWRYRPLERLPPGCETLVVLSGGRIPRGAYYSEAALAQDSLFRCLHAAELYRKSGPCLIVLSGGSVDPDEDSPPVAELMKQFLVDHGVDATDLLLEDASTTTYENARQCHELLGQRGVRHIALVTEATHMRRAASCFGKLGFQVTPAPCHFLTSDFEHRLQTYLPSPGAARGIQAVVHEWLGMAWYWCRGRI